MRNFILRWFSVRYSLSVVLGLLSFFEQVGNPNQHCCGSGMFIPANQKYPLIYIQWGWDYAFTEPAWTNYHCAETTQIDILLMLMSMRNTYMIHTWWLLSRTPGSGIVDTSEGVVGCHLVVVHLFFRFSAGFPPVLVCFTGSFHFHFRTCLRSWLTLSFSSSCLLSLLWVSSWRTPAVFLLWGCLASYSTALLLAQWRSSFWHQSWQIALPVRLLRLLSLSWLRHFLRTV
jgi:hypothetical protein